MCRRKTKIEIATAPQSDYERKPKKYAAIRGGKGYEHERGRVPHGGGGRQRISPCGARRLQSKGARHRQASSKPPYPRKHARSEYETKDARPAKPQNRSLAGMGPSVSAPRRFPKWGVGQAQLALMESFSITSPAPADLPPHKISSKNFYDGGVRSGRDRFSPSRRPDQPYLGSCLWVGVWVRAWPSCFSRSTSMT
jgi:hypothetical protein